VVGICSLELQAELLHIVNIVKLYRRLQSYYNTTAVAYIHSLAVVVSMTMPLRVQVPGC